MLWIALVVLVAKTLALAMLLVTLACSIASADDPTVHARRPTLAVSLGLGMMLDVDRTAGGASHEQGIFDDGFTGFKGEGAMTFGFSFMQPFSRYAALGVEAQYRSWASRQDSELGYPNYHALDFALLPRAQLPLSRRVMLIATLPIGISASFIDADIEHHTFREEASTGSGFNVGLFAGASVALHQRFGVRGELGLLGSWLHHSRRYASTNGQPIVNSQEDVSYATTALILRASFYLAL